MTSQSIALFQTQDAFEMAASHLSTEDICHAAQVCKSWAIAADQQGIWRQHFIKQFIPFVEGGGRDYKVDFQTLYPITLSGKTIEEFLGEFVGKMPELSLAWFNRLHDPDPFTPKLRICDTFVLVVEPVAIKRTFSKDVSAALDNQGNLAINLRVTFEETESATATDVEIPLTLPNLQTLTCNALSGKENAPVFYFGSDPAAFYQCAPAAAKVKLYLMRKAPVRGTFFKNFQGQKEYLEQRGFQAASVKTRALYNSIHIHAKGTCSDTDGLFVRTSDTMVSGGKMRHINIGRFETGRGFEINGKEEYSYIGAVPVASVEAISSLDLRKSAKRA